VPIYDYPFNERIRTLLRLEDLFAKIAHHMASAHALDHHAALSGLFQVLDVIDRAELKTDLLQELDRQKVVMESLRGKPAIAEEILDELIIELERAGKSLRASAGKLGQALRDNEWLMSVKQRAAIPGGLCEFDVPSYHYWLDLPEENRKCDLEGWLEHLMPLYNGLRIILTILRGSGAASPRTAEHGMYQQMLGGAKPAQMVRVELADGLAFFPEVSANKYAISIRFFEMDAQEKPHQCDADVEFTLTLCNL